MTPIEWLSTGVGLELTHAIIIVLLAFAGWLQVRTSQEAKRIATKLDEHINGSAPKASLS